MEAGGGAFKGKRKAVRKVQQLFRQVRPSRQPVGLSQLAEQVNKQQGDLPALLGSFALGPVCGVLICLIKNVLHLAFSNSMFVGELSNFILGAVFVAIAGNIYKHKKTKKSAVVSGLVAALVMGIVSVFSNYFVVYPVYYKAGMAEEAILQMYQAIAPSMKSVLQCLICFNLPFTIVKGLIAVVICMLIYKPLSPVLKGRLSEY